MEYFLVRYDSRVVIYEHRMYIRLATGDWHYVTSNETFALNITISAHLFLATFVTLFLSSQYG